MDPILASEIWTWKQDSPYGQPHDGSSRVLTLTARTPYWPDILLSRVIRPGAVRAGIRKHIGWHTFRHSFSTMLMANGENVKVVQELMRHANCRCHWNSIPRPEFRRREKLNIEWWSGRNDHPFGTGCSQLGEPRFSHESPQQARGGSIAR
jgi:integrase